MIIATRLHGPVLRDDPSLSALSTFVAGVIAADCADHLLIAVACDFVQTVPTMPLPGTGTVVRTPLTTESEAKTINSTSAPLALLSAVQDLVGVFRDSLSIMVVPVATPGFSPALNALTAKAANIAAGKLILFQSVEVTVSAEAVKQMQAQFQDGSTLVVGAALEGHNHGQQNATVDSKGRLVTALDGTTCPWNTCAMWNIRLLARTGFLTLSDGLKFPGSAPGGVEEVAVVALHQKMFPLSSRSVLLAFGEGDVVWSTAFSGESRRAWHARKMASKKERAEAQLSILFPKKGSLTSASEDSQNQHQQGGTTKILESQPKGRTDSHVYVVSAQIPETGVYGEIELCTAVGGPAAAPTPEPPPGVIESMAQDMASVKSKDDAAPRAISSKSAAPEAISSDQPSALGSRGKELPVIGAQDVYTYVEPLPQELTHSATVLLTGGAGFVGSHTAAHLLMRGNKVVVVDEVNDYYDVRQKEENIAYLRSLVQNDSNKFVFVRGDINDIPLMTQTFEEHKPSFIVHLAARAGVRPSLKDPYLYIRANILGTTALLEISRKFPFVKHFVYASSSSVYGGSTRETFTEKDIVDRPVSPYAATKKACELMAATFNHLYGIQVSGLRFFTVYGPRGRPDMAPYKFLKRAAKGIAIDQYGDGSSERDYTYVDDIVSGVVRTMDRPAGCQVYNLGNGRPITLKKFIGLVSEVAAPVKGLKINYMPDQPGDVKRTCADITKATIMLNYVPQTSFEEGLRKTFLWFLSRENKSDSNQANVNGSKLDNLQPGLKIVYGDFDNQNTTDSSTNSGSSSSEEDETMRSLSSSGSFDFAFMKRSISAPAGASQRIRSIRTAPKRRQFAYE